MEEAGPSSKQKAYLLVEREGDEEQLLMIQKHIYIYLYVVEELIYIDMRKNGI